MVKVHSKHVLKELSLCIAFLPRAYFAGRASIRFPGLVYNQSKYVSTYVSVGVLTLGSRPGVSSLCLTRVTLCADRENSVPSWGRWEWCNAL